MVGADAIVCCQTKRTKKAGIVGKYGMLFSSSLVLADRLFLSSISCLCVFWIDGGLGWGTSVRYVGYTGLRTRVV